MGSFCSFALMASFGVVWHHLERGRDGFVLRLGRNAWARRAPGWETPGGENCPRMLSPPLLGRRCALVALDAHQIVESRGFCGKSRVKILFCLGGALRAVRYGFSSAKTCAKGTSARR